MLDTIAIIIIGVLSIITSYTIDGFIHILLVPVISLFLRRVIRNR